MKIHIIIKLSIGRLSIKILISMLLMYVYLGLTSGSPELCMIVFDNYLGMDNGNIIWQNTNVTSF